LSDTEAVKRIGFITGIQKEAAILRKNSGIQKSDVKCAGANSDRANELASDLAQDGCDALISFGVAGALDPTLRPGDLIIPDQVISTNGDSFETSKDQLISHLGSRFIFKRGSLLGSDNLIASVTEKQALHKSTGSIAVDMESIGVAQAARGHGLPFLVIRAISDAADQDLPAASYQAVDDQGNIRIGSILLELVKNPSGLPDLIKMSGDSGKAFDTLRRVAALVIDY
jgi:adenosylhomocysteine nucleosidase|tara:strand:- start:2833 stop:3516 length:684 start_codon:yes stop_codon:yes gene_type:complete